MTYINHLNHFLAIAKKDQRLSCSHFSMYIALFYVWNGHRFTNPFHINRDELMALSHIGSKSTYSKVLDDLHLFGYITHEKPKSKYWKSRITIKRFLQNANEAQLNLFENGDQKPGQKPASKEPGTVPKSGHCQRTKPGHLPSQNRDANCPKTGTPTVPKLGRVIHRDIKEVIKREKDSAPALNSHLKKVAPKGSKKDARAGGQKCDTGMMENIFPTKVPGPFRFVNYSLTSTHCFSCLPPNHHAEAKPLPPPPVTNVAPVPSIPTLQQAIEFFKSASTQMPISSPLGGGREGAEAAKFHAHYTAIGWKLGGVNPILDWQAAARKWVLNCWQHEPRPIPAISTQGHLPGQSLSPSGSDYSAPL